MSHEGKMRRGENSKDPTNIDRIYFLEQSKPKDIGQKSAEFMEEPKKKKVKKDDD